MNDRDLSTQVNYKMHMNIRRMMGEHKHRHKRSKKLLKVRMFLEKKKKKRKNERMRRIPVVESTINYDLQLK